MTRILIVDDEKDLLIIYGSILKKAGYIIDTAGTGARCFIKLSEFKPDLVLLDINLPDTDGYKILSEIKTTKEFEHIFVIMISGEEISPENMAHGLESGADEYMIKPTGSQELLSRVRAMVRLKTSENKLRKAKKDLEKKITEQVLELEEINNDLRMEIKIRKTIQQNLSYDSSLLVRALELRFCICV
jgi:DNA-binding response OmpR family regulator